MTKEKSSKSGGIAYLVISCALLFGLFLVHKHGSLSVKGIEATKSDDPFAFYFILIALAVCCFYILFEGLKKLFFK